MLSVFIGSLSLLLSACGSDSPNTSGLGANNSAGVNANQVQPGSSPASSNANSGTLSPSAFLLLTKESTLYKVNALNGSAEALETFADGPDFVGVPDIVDNTVFITSDDNALNAIALDSGEFFWDIPLGEYDSDSNPSTVVCDDDTCYVAGDTGELFAINAADGSVKWSNELLPDNGRVRHLVSDLLVDGNRIYLNVGQREFLASEYLVPIHLVIVNRETGRIEKEFDFPAGHDVSGDAIVLVDGQSVLRVDSETFDTVWSYSDPAWEYDVPTIVGNVVVLTMFDNISQRTLGLDLITGNPLWSVDAGTHGSIFTPTTDGRIVIAAIGKARGCSYFCPEASGVMAIDPTNGAVLWQRTLTNQVENPLIAKGAAFFGWFRDRFEDSVSIEGAASLNAGTGTLNWTATGIANRGVSWFVSTPVLVQDGQVYRSSIYPDARP